MSTQISGDTGVSQCQPNSVSQDDLQSGVVGKGPALRVHRGTDFALPNNTWTQLFPDVVDWNISGSWTNPSWTPSVAGYYQVDASVHLGGGGIIVAGAGIYKNGSVIAISFINCPSASEIILCCSDLVYLNGISDSIQLWGYINGTAPVGKGGQLTRLSASLVRAA